MRRILLAIRVFFRILFDSAAGQTIETALEGGPAEDKPTPAKPRQPVVQPPGRSEALTLLATLQREARFVDFLQERLDDYNDAQIGAVARDVHRDCGKVIARLFAIRPAVDAEEGAEMEVPAGFDPGRYRLTGNVAGEPPFRGRLTHHGWEAASCQVPAFTGSKDAARVVAPVEVELP